MYLRADFKPILIKAEFYSRGKVLLSAEYLVVHGASCVALPTKRGQRMKVSELTGSEIIWTCYDSSGKKWFEAEIDLMGFDIINTTDESNSKNLRKLFKACCNNNSEFLSHWKKYKVDHYLEFPMEWGLGSSSTLIRNMALWADINPYHLYFDVEQGSGYDVACAGSEEPIMYTLGDGVIDLQEVDFNPSFAQSLYFLVLGNKVSSSDAIKSIKNKQPDKSILKKATDLSEKLLNINSLNSFENWISEHENLIGGYLGKPKIKDLYFSDYWGAVKSLGAWGGDLALVTSQKSNQETMEYFKSKGYSKLIPFRELV